MAEPVTQATRRLPRTERREQIIAAATRAFAGAGFAATNLDDIAAEAGVSRAILYRHFDSKTDLYQAVLDSACGRLIASVGADEFTEATGELHIASLISLGLVLFIITFAVLAMARLLIGRQQNL